MPTKFKFIKSSEDRFCTIEELKLIEEYLRPVNIVELFAYNPDLLQEIFNENNIVNPVFKTDYASDEDYYLSYWLLKTKENTYKIFFTCLDDLEDNLDCELEEYNKGGIKERYVFNRINELLSLSNMPRLESTEEESLNKLPKVSDITSEELGIDKSVLDKLLLELFTNNYNFEGDIDKMWGFKEGTFSMGYDCDYDLYHPDIYDFVLEVEGFDNPHQGFEVKFVQGLYLPKQITTTFKNKEDFIKYFKEHINPNRIGLRVLTTYSYLDCVLMEEWLKNIDCRYKFEIDENLKYQY